MVHSQISLPGPGIYAFAEDKSFEKIKRQGEKDKNTENSGREIDETFDIWHIYSL